MKIEFSSKKTSEHQIIFYSHKKKLIIPDSLKKNNQILPQFLNSFLELPEIEESKQKVHQLLTPNFERIILVGLAEKEDALEARKLGGLIAKEIKSLPKLELNLRLPANNRNNTLLYNQLGEILEGILLGTYRFEDYLAKKKTDKFCNILKIITQDSKIIETLEKSIILAESTNLARNWGNLPGNDFTPTDFQKTAKLIAKEADLKISSLDEKQLKKLGMNLLLGVSSGSVEPAFLNILEYRVKSKKAPTLMLVGKGLTFDSGGISLKPGASMEEMKFDMCGGAAVLGAMRAIGLLKPDINVIGLIPSSENLPDAAAVKPGDILTAYNGKTVEIINTDAEGRLILADSLAYGIEKFKPNAVIDIATLTGACVVALGSFRSGLISNNEKLSQNLNFFGKKTGDLLWPLPIGKEYSKMLKSDYADLKNIGGKEAGATTAACFLEEFIDDTPWAHLDIAGTAWGVNGIDFIQNKGATGVGVRLLSELALNWKAVD